MIFLQKRANVVLVGPYYSSILLLGTVSVSLSLNSLSFSAASRFPAGDSDVGERQYMYSLTLRSTPRLSSPSPAIMFYLRMGMIISWIPPVGFVNDFGGFLSSLSCPANPWYFYINEI